MPGCVLYVGAVRRLFYSGPPRGGWEVGVLLPPLAMTGTHRGAYEVTERAAQPQWRAEHIKPAPPAQRSVIDGITLFYFPILYGSAIVLVFMARGVRAMLESRRGMITVSYPNRKVREPRGLSIL